MELITMLATFGLISFAVVFFFVFWCVVIYGIGTFLVPFDLDNRNDHV